MCVCINPVWSVPPPQWMLFYVELTSKHLHIYEGNDSPTVSRRVSSCVFVLLMYFQNEAHLCCYILWCCCVGVLISCVGPPSCDVVTHLSSTSCTLLQFHHLTFPEMAAQFVLLVIKTLALLHLVTISYPVLVLLLCV